MNDSQFSPLTAAVVKALTDKLYEKRKVAALDIEKQVREIMKAGNLGELDRIISVLDQLALSPNGNSRNGGLIGLAATAIALGKEHGEYTLRLMEPVFSCFTDADSRVRYFACESLYNIVKVNKTRCLEKLDQIFDILWKLSSDTDQNVRSGSELLDRLLKEIVVSTKTIDLEEIMLLLRERIYCVNSSNRRFIISWLDTIITVPAFTVTHYIPEVVDGVFKALEDPTPAIREATLSVLKEMLFKLNPASGDEVNINAIINILVIQASSITPICREIAIIWLNQILIFYQEKIINNLSSYLISILPLISDASLKANELNQRLLDLFKEDSFVPMDSVVEVLLAHLRNEQPECRVATLNWIRHLFSCQQNNLLSHMERFFPVLLELLSDKSDEVLILDITLITEICSQRTANSIDFQSLNLSDETSNELKLHSPYLVKFCVSLLKMFKGDHKLMEERGTQIVRQICLLLEPRQVFSSLAILLNSTIDDSGGEECDGDMEFTSKMVALLNRILMTSCELFKLRQLIRHPENNNYVALFNNIYRCWCHQPICLLSFYILTQNYIPALDLVHRFSDLDLTVDLLLEIDHLVQLIESPILAYVRMDLLNPEYQKPLSAILSALLMLLPQTEAFNMLQRRLQLVSNLTILDSKKSPPKTTSTTASLSTTKIKFKELIQYYDKVTAYRAQKIRRLHQTLLEDSVK